MIASVDMVVIVAYFLFVIGLGFAFKSQVSDISEYFRGGGKMLWWMIGSTQFMVTFSAWTFTGAAAKAYEDGFAVAFIFAGNALAAYITSRFFAHRFRQLRIISPMQAIKQRYGRVTEQCYVWTQFFVGLVPSALTLIAVSIFMSAVFGWDLQTTIVVTGASVTFISLTGGSWAVVASDFVQALLIGAVGLVTAWFALDATGGFVNLITEFPADSVISGNNLNYSSLFILWIVVTAIQKMVGTNSVEQAPRYLAAKDGDNARKAAKMSAILSACAIFIWFLPPMASAILYPNLAEMYPTLNNPTEAAYLAFVANMMPAGMLGLLVSAMFASTMSSMDSMLNVKSAMLVKCVYQPFVRKNASEKELLLASKGFTLFIAAGQISVSLILSSMEGLGLFQLMIMALGLLMMPMAVPSFMAMFIRKTPEWSAWSTIIFGMTISFLASRVFNAHWANDTFNLSLTGREINDLNLVITYTAHLTLTVGWFLMTTLFYKAKDISTERQEEIDNFYRNMNTPIEVSEGAVIADNAQRVKLGKIALLFGFFISLLIFVPNDSGRLAFLVCGGLPALVGALLIRSGLKGQKQEAALAPAIQ